MSETVMTLMKNFPLKIPDKDPGVLARIAEKICFAWLIEQICPNLDSHYIIKPPPDESYKATMTRGTRKHLVYRILNFDINCFYVSLRNKHRPVAFPRCGLIFFMSHQKMNEFRNLCKINIEDIMTDENIRQEIDEKRLMKYLRIK